jgi:hypothetical protein
VRGGGFKEGKSRRCITALTQRLQRAELGGGVVEGGGTSMRGNGAARDPAGPAVDGGSLGGSGPMQRAGLIP